jgi:PAS domain S-box-containing protein
MQNEELRRTQAELTATKARYFDLYGLALVGYVTLSEPGVILETNLTAATLLGVVRSALVKRPFSQFILKEDQDTYYLLRQQLLAAGPPPACELRMVKKDGHAFWARLEGNLVQDEDVPLVCRLVLSDITERKQAEAALRESRTKYWDAIHFAVDGILFGTPDGRITHANSQMQKLAGRNLGEFSSAGSTSYLTPRN